MCARYSLSHFAPVLHWHVSAGKKPDPDRVLEYFSLILAGQSTLKDKLEELTEAQEVLSASMDMMQDTLQNVQVILSSMYLHEASHIKKYDAHDRACMMLGRLFA